MCFVSQTFDHSEQGWAKCDLSSASGFVTKILMEHSHTHLRAVYGSFRATVAEVIRGNRYVMTDCMAHKPQIFTIWFFKKSLPPHHNLEDFKTFAVKLTSYSLDNKARKYPFLKREL